MPGIQPYEPPPVSAPADEPSGDGAPVPASRPPIPGIQPYEPKPPVDATPPNEDRDPMADMPPIREAGAGGAISWAIRLIGRVIGRGGAGVGEPGNPGAGAGPSTAGPVPPTTAAPLPGPLTLPIPQPGFPFDPLTVPPSSPQDEFPDGVPGIASPLPVDDPLLSESDETGEVDPAIEPDADAPAEETATPAISTGNADLDAVLDGTVATDGGMKGLETPQTQEEFEENLSNIPDVTIERHDGPGVRATLPDGTRVSTYPARGSTGHPGFQVISDEGVTTHKGSLVGGKE